MAEPTHVELEIAVTHARLGGAHHGVIRILERARYRRDAHPDGTELPAMRLASWLQVNPPYARRVLRELVELGVIERTVEGAGRRAHMFRFRPIASWDAFRDDRRLLEVVQLRVKQAVVARGTGPEPGVAQYESVAQDLVAPHFRRAQQIGSTAKSRGTKSDLGPRNFAALRNGHDAGTPFFSGESSRSLTAEGGSEHAQPVIDAALELTDVFGSPLHRIAAACELVDEAGVRELAQRVAVSQVRNAVALAELVELQARRIATRATAPAPPPRPSFDVAAERAAWDAHELVPPDFSAARARLRETAGTEVTQ